MVQFYFKLPINKQSSSIFYKIVANAMHGNCENLRLMWQRDLNVNIDEDSWAKIISSPGWFTREARGKFTL